MPVHSARSQIAPARPSATVQPSVRLGRIGGTPGPASGNQAVQRLLRSVENGSRATETIFRQSLLGSEALERARRYQPRLRERTPTSPTISPPPILVDEALQPPAVCPNAQEAAQAIQQNQILERTRNRMRFAITQSTNQPRTQVTSAMIRQADRAIRAEFGPLLPAGRSYTAPQSVTIRTPQQLAQLRVPDPATARRRIGQAALANTEDEQVLASQCITEPDHPVLESAVNAPLLQQLGISFVQDYEQAHVGGQTTGLSSQPARPHVDLPSENRNMGHIVVHEGLHFYVHGTYAQTASGDPREDELMEGGAEFLARHVLNTRLANVPGFEINPRTYADEFSYVGTYLTRGGFDVFARAYFQGRVDLLGLTPPSHP